MFRPVLGRKSISPGMRQLFAIASLPTDDVPAAPGAAVPPQLLNAKVRTYWKKYDRGTMTSFDKDDATRRSKFLYGISFGLAKPEIFGSQYVNETNYANIKVQSTEHYQENLKPKVDKVWWVPVGPKSILLSINGNNFFNGTQVTLGDRIYSGPADGLIVKSNQSMDLTLPIDVLSTSTAGIIGRYGPAIPLNMGAAAKPAGIVIPDGVSLGPNLSGLRSLRIPLFPKTAAQLRLADLPVTPAGERLTPLVTVNGKVLSPNYEITEVAAVAAKAAIAGGGGVIGQVAIPAVPAHLLLHVQLPESALNEGGAAIKVSWPFQSEAWTATARLYEPSTGFRILRTASDRLVISSMDARGFTSLPLLTGCWRLLVGGDPIDILSTTCTAGSGTKYSENTVEVKLAAAAPDKVVLVTPEGFPYQLDVPKLAAAETPAPKTCHP